MVQIKYKKCCLGTEKEYTNHHRVTLLDNPDIEPIPFQLEVRGKTDSFFCYVIVY